MYPIFQQNLLSPRRQDRRVLFFAKERLLFFLGVFVPLRENTVFIDQCFLVVLPRPLELA